MSKTSKALDLNLDSLIATMVNGSLDFTNLSWKDCESAAEELERLREERDEARREVCVLSVIYANFYSVGEEKEAARDRGWDCFKEETP